MAAVLALGTVADALRLDGMDDEAAARDLVRRRNASKAMFGAADPPAIVAVMEARDRAKYGDPIGPGPEWFLARHGSWTLVIEAARRPADSSAGR